MAQSLPSIALVCGSRGLFGLLHMRFQDLRHTYASLVLAAGFKPYEARRWMGHASVSMNDTIYGHLYPTDYDDQIARFEALVAARWPG